jgi:hypothetical protein
MLLAAAEPRLRVESFSKSLDASRFCWVFISWTEISALLGASWWLCLIRFYSPRSMFRAAREATANCLQKGLAEEQTNAELYSDYYKYGCDFFGRHKILSSLAFFSSETFTDVHMSANHLKHTRILFPQYYVLTLVFCFACHRWDHHWRTSIINQRASWDYVYCWHIITEI